MSEGLDVDGVDRDSDLYGRYARAATRRLDDDADFRRAREGWERFHREAHGDVLDSLSVGADELFVDAAYVDFLVSGLLATAEETLGVAVSNPDPLPTSGPFALRSLHERVIDPGEAEPFEHLDAGALARAGVDDLRRLYGAVVPRERRLALGEYYTPKGVARLAVDELDLEPGTTVLDPGCGSGAFLVAAIERVLEGAPGDAHPDEVVAAVTDAVFGVDLNPVAVGSAKLAYVLALAPVLGESAVDEVTVPVAFGDALGATDAGEPDRVPETVDRLVGNPPWITWDRLPETVRERWRSGHVEDLSLFPHEGTSARLGHGNDDVSVPFAWVCIDRHLARGGSAAFVLKRSAMKGPAGRALRSLRVGDRSLSLRRVHDFGDLRPFAGVDAGTAVYVLDADEAHQHPTPATVWHGEAAPTFGSRAAMAATCSREATDLVPVEAGDPAASWVRADAERDALGECAHEIRHGLKDDAKAVFSLDREELDSVDADLVYPYLRSRHVVAYGLFGHDLQLVPLRQANEDNEAELAAEYPRTYDYLRAHRGRLEERSSAWLSEGGTFYDLFGLGPYTWANYKVVWCRLGFAPQFAVVSTVEDDDVGEKTVVPGDHCMFLATDDRETAHFLCALLNSAPYQRCLRDVAGDGKSALTKGVVSKLWLPGAPETPRARRLAELSERAHGIVPAHTDVSKREFNRTTIPELAAVQAEIDECAEALLAERER